MTQVLGFFAGLLFGGILGWFLAWKKYDKAKTKQTIQSNLARRILRLLQEAVTRSTVPLSVYDAGLIKAGRRPYQIAILRKEASLSDSYRLCSVLVESDGAICITWDQQFPNSYLSAEDVRTPEKLDDVLDRLVQNVTDLRPVY